MSKINPEKLSVEYRNGYTVTQPAFPRRYTLTHSDTTGNLFLTIANNYSWDKINRKMRDEVLGEWITYGGNIFFMVNIYIDQGEHDLSTSKRRTEIFKRELPLALTAIRYGDRYLFDKYPNLDYALIIVNFISTYPQLDRQENWSTFSNFSVESLL